MDTPGARVLQEGPAIERVNIRLVAARAGVSVATVSRVMRRHPGVRDLTRQRVEAAARELNYRPEAARAGRPARAAASRGRVALFVPHENEHELHLDGLGYFQLVFSGVRRTLSRAGRALEVLAYDEAELPGLMHRVLTGERAASAALMVHASTRDESLLEGEPPPAPTVLVNRRGTSHVSSVLVDDLIGGRAAGEHLLSLGHVHVGCVAGPADHAFYTDRLEGFLDAYRTAGSPVPTSRILRAPLGVEAGRAAAARWLDDSEPVTAIYAAEEAFGEGALEFIESRGLSVPEDVSLITYSDYILLTRRGRPVTTVRVPAFELGEISAQAAIHLSTLGGGHFSARVPPTLVVRKSTAPRNKRRTEA